MTKTCGLLHSTTKCTQHLYSARVYIYHTHTHNETNVSVELARPFIFFQYMCILFPAEKWRKCCFNFLHPSPFIHPFIHARFYVYMYAGTHFTNLPEELTNVCIMQRSIERKCRKCVYLKKPNQKKKQCFRKFKIAAVLFLYLYK